MLYTLQELMDMEEGNLRPYAVCSKKSKGRVHKEREDLLDINGVASDKPPRLPFQKDRDKIMHCRAFRRLQGKTQVFVAHFGDHFRTRLTHSIEVAQVSRDLARNLGLNEDLAESVALAHDLGHTPFGHSGQDALNECMQEYGLNFEHNEQSLRIVDKLEDIYPHFKGLNLSHEVREGMMKHQTSSDNSGAKIIAHPSLEGQLVNLADEIAYNNHDIDDGLRAGLLTLQELAKLELWQRALAHTHAKYGNDISQRHLISRTISATISLMIRDVLEYSTKLIEEYNIQTLEDVYAYGKPLISFSPEMLTLNANLKSYLARTFYASKQVLELSYKGQGVIKTLFTYYMQNEAEFPGSHNPNEPLAIRIKDYIAGMTDEFAEETRAKIKNV
ncbi:MAG: deoxyguanosinetriphosphate triphosphohydrolase [Candidatus Peregrinibacteria bacterium]|nr:deoxyguanosinetriphosphate triphosphohydrolase [Candidatus Peregrinibacteria bacterium]MDZ4244696.1 deoxyguanosinetriphosphate triphosphohydrolase [Candidatus Gracilibacteria bacterium]